MLPAMLLVAGTPFRDAWPAGSAIAGALGTLAIWLEPYRRARFFAFLHPWHDAQGTGFQIVQAMIGMGSGGIFGVGLGQGVQKIFYLPRGAHRHDAREHRRGARARRRRAVISAYLAVRLRRPEDRARAAATRSESGSRSG